MQILRFQGNTHLARIIPEIKTLPGRLILVSGPSGAGKGSILSGLFADPEIKGRVDQVPSLTTRAPRPGEVPPPTSWIAQVGALVASTLKLTPPRWLHPTQPPPATQYEFVSPETFQKLDNAQALFQSAFYDNHYYGSRVSVILDKLKKGINVLFELASKDALAIKALYPEKVTTVFIAPPPTDLGLPPDASLLEKQLKTLMKRLLQRGTNSDDSIYSRLEKARSELALQPQFDVTIVNEDQQLGKAIAQLKTLAISPHAPLRFAGHGSRQGRPDTTSPPHGLRGFVG